MADDNLHEGASPHPFFVHADFPFVFIPTRPTTHFDFIDDDDDDDDDDNDDEDFNNHHQTNSQFTNENKKDEVAETVDDEVDNNEENEDDIGEKDNLRISQPKYSELLKHLDFSHTRMVDVTNLLSDDPNNYLPDDENKVLNDENLSSTHQSTDEKSSVNIDNNQTKNNENYLNNLADIIQQASHLSPYKYDYDPNNQEYIIIDPQKKTFFEEDDDTSKQATQNYDLHDYENEVSESLPKSNKNVRSTTNENSHDNEEENLSSIPRLNRNGNNRREVEDQQSDNDINWNNLIYGKDQFNQPRATVVLSEIIDENHRTPNKKEKLLSNQEKILDNLNLSSKTKVDNKFDDSSETDSVSENEFNLSKEKEKKDNLKFQSDQSIDKDLNDLNNDLNEVIYNKDQPYRTATDILLQRLANQQTDNKTNQYNNKSHHIQHDDYIQSKTHDIWLSMLEKLEQEHKQRLEKQQKQYEEYMLHLEENMKQRLDQYLTSTNSVQKSKSDISNQSFNEHDINNSLPIDSNETIHSSYSNSNQYRPLADQVNKHHYPTNHLLTSNIQQQPIQTNISRSQSREDISNLRNELSAKHAKHVSDLKLYYEHEIDELKNELNISRMGHPNSSITRQSIETIERINNENIRLHDHIKQLRQSLKTSDEENNSLKRQLEELRGQINNKDIEIKNSHRKSTEIEQELNAMRLIKDQQNEKYAYVNRQSLFYQEEYQKLTRDLNLTRERLTRLEENYRQLENQHKTCRQQTFTNENNNQRINHDNTYNSAMSLNVPTSKEYGRFTLIQSKYSSETITKSRDENIDSGTYTSDGSDDLFRHSNSRRPVDKISDFVGEQDCYPHAYVQSSRPFYSLNKFSTNGHRSSDQMPVRDFNDNKIKESEKLESKFDELLNKKRDLESRINRIPIRGLTTTDRQLLDTLEREIQRVEQQISSVKLELRKMNILPTY